MHLAYIREFAIHTDTIMNNLKNQNVQDCVCDFGNLYQAMRKCKHNVMWKDSVAGYVKNGLANCYKLKQSLYNGKYSIDPYITFTITEPKEREIVSTRIKDRVFQRSLADNYLYDTLTKSFVHTNGACQKNKGTDFARQCLKDALHKYYRNYGKEGYVLKCDIKSFFASTTRTAAINAVESNITDDWALSRVIEIVDSYTAETGKGLGLGSQITQLIELSVLNSLDHYIKEVLRIKCYVRYMDDFVLIHPDKVYLKYCKEQIAKKLAESELSLSVNKTQIFPLSQPIHFLGNSYRLTDTGKVIMKMLPEKVAREKRKLRRQRERVKQGKMTKTEVYHSYQGFRNNALKGNNRNIITEMDKYFKSLWEE